MAPLVLGGENLGEKRKHYNLHVNEAIINKTITEIPPINYKEEDIDNLFKIDIACNHRNINYILDVYKCSDMLYISRAIKQSIWLINDSKYEHIINPEYLFHELFPQMTTKAKNKLLLAIRLNLRNEQRVEDFCKYLMLENLQTGLKWLPYCSVSFIEETIEKHAIEIPKSLMTRLCQRSIRFFEIFIQKNHYAADIAQAALFLLKENTDFFLNIVEPTKHRYRTPQFGPKPTQKIMKKCPERIINNFENYADYINMAVFAKFIKRSELKAFILKHMKNDRLSYFLKNNIQHFLKRLPFNEKFEFIKTHFIGKMHDNENEIMHDTLAMSCSRKSYRIRDPTFTSANVYKWYKFAPYNTAFKEINKLIKSESNPIERCAMITIILQCARKDLNNIASLLQYYREHHINEPFKFKIQFINSLLSKTDVCKYESKTWNNLNDIFISMEVYEKSNNDVQSCIQSVILYNLVHNITIPNIIQDKFVFDTFKKYQNKLSDENKAIVFNYLYNQQINKLDKLSVNSEREFNETFNLLENILTLLSDWKKNLSEYSMVQHKIKKLVSTKYQNSWNVDISKLYNLKKEWRKLFFNESILLNPTVEVAINILKHDSAIINNRKSEIFALCAKENTLLRRFLNIIRIFWPQTLAVVFKEKFLDDIHINENCPAKIYCLSVLLPQKEFSQLIIQYVPTGSKIDWSQENEKGLSVRRHLAKKLHMARPQPSLADALLYAKGDYLQYILPSLNSILYNTSSLQARYQLTNLLNAPVSLQKHGIRTAIAKLQHDELKLTFTNLWNSTKNSSIRADIMKQTFHFLCKQHSPNNIEEIWSLLKIFIQNLTAEENKNIYATLCRVNEVPMSVKAEFWMISYKFFRSLPQKANCASLINKLKDKMTDVIELLDPDFIANIYLETFDSNFIKQSCSDLNNLSVYLLTAKDMETQKIRYHKVMLPIMEKAFTCWEVQYKEKYYVKSNFNEIFTFMLREFEECVLSKGIILPEFMFSNIYQKLNSELPIRKNYTLITVLKLSQSYVKILDGILKIKSKDTYKTQAPSDKTFEWKLLHIEAAFKFGKVCVEYLKEDINIYFQSIYILFANALEDFFRIYDTTARLTLLKTVLEYEEFIEGYLLVLKLLPNYVYEEEDKSLKSEILNIINAHPSEEINMHYCLYEHLS